MSNLLEEAIIDANALRETALKSAQDALIEKYKDEFRESVEKLFEQEELTMGSAQDNPIQPEQSIDQASLGVTEEPGGSALKNVPSSFLDGDNDDEIIVIDFDQIEKQISNILSSPVLAAPEELPQANLDTTAEQPATQELSEELDLYEEKDEEESDDEEEGEIDTKKSDLDNDGKLSDYEKNRGMAISKSMKDLDEDLELELEEAYDQSNDEGLNIDALTEYDSFNENSEMAQKTADIDQQIARLNQQLATLKSEKAKLQASSAEELVNKAQETSDDSSDVEITEEEIQELAEELKVDIEVEGLLDGHMGTHQGEKREVRNMELAAARDECEVDDREEELEKLQDLKKELNESRSQNKKYSNLIEELKDNLIVLKEQTEKLSISNAKLLYTNKVFANNSLNERQKQNIVESISKAGSVLEARTIFGTLQSAVEGIASKNSKESLSEALNRGNKVFSVRPKANHEEIGFSDRLKILAGIK